MRLIALLKHNDKQHVDKDIDDKRSYVYKYYDQTLYNRYKWMSDIYDDDIFIANNFKWLVYKSHPFINVKRYITSSFIPGNTTITNAFMKLYEILTWLDVNNMLNIRSEHNLKMFDIASAPGMFILATEAFIKCNYKNISLDWHACSRIKTDNNEALDDTYGLFKHNPTRYTPCDILNVKDIENILKKQHKYQLVTGDIGIPHTDYSKLQEELQLQLEWRQAYLGLNLIDTHGTMVLKMYSLTSIQNLLLLDILSTLFESIYLVKPYTSRIFNDECYIVGVNRNSVLCEISIDCPYISSYTSSNISIIRSFEYSRVALKYNTIQMLKEYRHNNIDQYKLYMQELTPTLELISNIGTSTS